MKSNVLFVSEGSQPDIPENTLVSFGIGIPVLRTSMSNLPVLEIKLTSDYSPEKNYTSARSFIPGLPSYITTFWVQM